jgi:hypothetical protein
MAHKHGKGHNPAEELKELERRLKKRRKELREAEKKLHLCIKECVRKCMKAIDAPPWHYGPQCPHKPGGGP